MTRLKRHLGTWDVFCIGSGAMISSGLFILPSIAFAKAGPSIVISYFIAGILMIPSIFAQAELASAMPKGGGTYFFIQRSVGSFVGMFSGFANWFSIGLKSAFALVGIGAFLEYVVKGAVPYEQIKIAAAFFCLVFMFLNLFSIKSVASIQRYLVVFLFAALIIYIAGGAYYFRPENFSPFMPMGFKSMLGVSGLVFISYGGITKVAAIAEDTKNPHRTLPMGMFLSFFCVQLIYIGAILVTEGVLPQGEIISTLTPLTHGAFKLGGTVFAVIISLAAMVAFITTANAGMLTSSRIPLAMAEDDLLPKGLTRISRKFHSPYVSVILTALFLLCFILFLDLEQLVKVASTLMIILFILVNLAVIIMRESKIINYRPIFKTPLYPWMPIFAVVAYSFLIVEMGKFAISVSLGFILLSVIVYYLFVARTERKQSAMMHLVERITARELADTSLEQELQEIIHKRDNVVKDRFDHILESCPILDIPGSISKEDLFLLVADKLAERLELKSDYIIDLLNKREQQSTTVIEKGLAIPHIIVEGERKFEIIVVRAGEGIIFSPGERVKVVFVLAGSLDERNFHLRVLMSIAQIVREHNFSANFARARNESQLRMLLLSSTRKRQLPG